MAKKSNRQKVRTNFRKNRGSRARGQDLTRRYRQDDASLDEIQTSERVSGKGDLTRRRTVAGAEVNEDDGTLQLAVNESECLSGRVMEVRGLVSEVRTATGDVYQCATRRLLKTIQTEQRHVVAVGDRVLIRPADNAEGIIERVEPRWGILSRTSNGRQHVIVANVDQILIITSAAAPEIKPNLIDRMLLAAAKTGIKPLICINKIDLVDSAHLQPLVGSFGQLGYRVLMVSAETGFGIDRLKDLVEGKQTVLAGQSGVGKSSLLNAMQPELNLRVRTVSTDNEKGRHTTTTAKLIPFGDQGYLVDTPGIRQFQLWDVIPEEVATFYPDIRPFVSHCRYPDCSHIHETDCAVKDAVADGRINVRRYESYCHLYQGDAPPN